MSATTTPDIVASTGIREAVEASYDLTVREDIELFRRQAAQYTAGELTADEFRPFRLRRGVYTQRQEGVHMIRTKVPGGQLTAAQMDRLAEVAERWGGGRGHLTTRQNMQYHFVPLAQVPDALHALADARLTTREACYNTVRNVTGCNWAGLLEGEIFDVTPYVRKIAFAFLHKELTDNLPRKFKISACGCPKDCSAGAMHDVGLRAVVREENGELKKGFRILVGGGLGPLPTEARILDEFLPVEQVVGRIEAVIRVFNQFGNRGNKNKARLKFVMRERGFDWLREQIEREYADILTNGGIASPGALPDGFGGYQAAPAPLGLGAELPVLSNGHHDAEYEAWHGTNVTAQRQAGFSVVTAYISQGNMTAEQMHGLAELARKAGDATLRFTIEQNVALPWVPTQRVKQVYSELKRLGLASGGAREISDIITCPGAYSCNLALTKTMNLGWALVDAVKGYDDPGVRALTIKASGCPNSCGQHWIGDLGFYGNSRKVNGKEIPYYLMLLGGGYDETGVMRFGLAVQSIPARLAPEAVKRVLDHFLANRQEGETFRQYVLRHKMETFKQLTADLAKPAEMFPEIYKDWGDDVDFSLQLGRGECAA